MGKASARQAGLAAAVIPRRFPSRDGLGGCPRRGVPITSWISASEGTGQYNFPDSGGKDFSYSHIAQNAA